MNIKRIFAELFGLCICIGLNGCSINDFIGKKALIPAIIIIDKT